jgi:hypothetical protein
MISNIGMIAYSSRRIIRRELLILLVIKLSSKLLGVASWVAWIALYASISSRSAGESTSWGKNRHSPLQMSRRRRPIGHPLWRRVGQKQLAKCLWKPGLMAAPEHVCMVPSAHPPHDCLCAVRLQYFILGIRSDIFLSLYIYIPVYPKPLQLSELLPKGMCHREEPSQLIYPGAGQGC